MKEQILELRQAGKSYKEICRTLSCSIGTVSYHCGKGQKEKSKRRQTNRRKDLVILSKVQHFQDRKLKDKTEDFQRERNGRGNLGRRTITFNWKDVIEKFGWETTCYLTGRKIDLKEPLTYQFDHVISKAKGGESTIDNLGICCRDANQAKHDMSVEELLSLCKEMLEYNGYEVKRK
jgi:5-methylcytosine-specific restriction endonuclease McrA